MPLSIRFALAAYNLLWIPLVPLLFTKHRLREGFAERTLIKFPEFKAELWIHAASVGEAFLALEILKTLDPAASSSVLITTNTSQGHKILTRGTGPGSGIPGTVRTGVSYIPFDKPSIMTRALKLVNPRVVVLLELELWPGLLMACKKNGAKVMVINGRIKEKSLRQYLFWPRLWKVLAPERTLAMSPENGERFGVLFGREQVGVMHNIKFDRIVAHEPIPRDKNPIGEIVPETARFLVLGSVREEEEAEVAQAIQTVYMDRPETVTGLFPRHSHRLGAWEKKLDALGLKWLLRSTAKGPVEPGTVILWDTFGELTSAYELAHAAFTGGSLAPLGGQNFLEPLISGVIPVSGPSWYNFDWVGEEIVQKKLLHIVNDPEQMAARLVKVLDDPPDRTLIRSQVLDYVRSRQGGTKQACEEIEAALQGKGN